MDGTRKMRAIVVGAGPAGLATAACLQREGIETRVLERTAHVASSWRGHYDSLSLHTARGRSGLPFLPLPKSVGRYPSRDELIAYLEDYAERLSLDIRFDCAVRRVRRAGRVWRVSYGHRTDQATIVVLATGLNAQPRIPGLPGQEAFGGEILHSSAYRDPSPFEGKRVLVVGFGNSGGDIARDLAQAGIEVGLCVRGPINILPKEILGIPVTSMGLLGKLFPPHVADALTAPVVRAIIGRPERYGLRQAAKGPLRQVIEDGKIPLIDVGALPEIRAGRIRVYPGIDTLQPGGVRFEGGGSAPFDAIILATGYDYDLRAILPDEPGALDRNGHPRISGGPTGAPGLYFCSYRVSANGQIRQAGVEAMAIARHAARLAAPAAGAE